MYRHVLADYLFGIRLRAVGKALDVGTSVQIAELVNLYR